MTTRWCFQCGLDYADTVATCVECGVETVDYEPRPPHLVGGDDETQLAYELHSWPYEARAEAERLLRGGGIAHGWQGPTLIVLEADEDAADKILAGIDAGDDDGPVVDLEAVDVQPEPGEGPEPYEVIEGLFLASGDLGRNPRDSRAGARVEDLAAFAAEMRQPFGFDAPVWSAIVLSSAELAEAIDAANADDLAGDAADQADDAVADQAAALASLLKMYV